MQVVEALGAKLGLTNDVEAFDQFEGFLSQCRWA